MKKIFSILLFCCFAIIMQAQIENQIIGTWNVDSVWSTKPIKLNNKEKKQLKQLSKSEVIFMADNHAKFRLYFTGFNITDGYWYYNKEKDVIVITKWNDKNTDRMRLWYDILDDGRLQLYIDESPFVLIVSPKKEE
ncbi:MAG: hypothetical protein J6V18_07490 [Bacteroidales bacterium]|nr:hypothetical protein [Bacteroidales bacterium]